MFKVCRFILVGILSFQLVSPSVCVAQDAVQDVNDYTPFTVKMVDAVHPILIPITGAIVGYVTCGALCSVAGSILGIVDSLMPYAEYHPLIVTTGAVALIVKSQINFPLVLVSSGVITLNQLFKSANVNITSSDYLVPIADAVLGNLFFGKIGIVIGVTLGGIDQIANHFSGTGRHYLTGALVATVLGNKIAPFNSQILGGGIGGITGVFLIHFFETKFCQDMQQMFELIEASYNFATAFLPKEEIIPRITEYAIVSFGNGLLLHRILEVAANYRQAQLDPQRLNLVNHNQEAWQKYLKIVRSNLVFIVPIVTCNIYNRYVGKYFNFKIFTSLNNRVQDAVFQEHPLLILLQHPNGTMILDNLREDTFDVVNDGFDMALGLIDVLGQGLQSFSLLIQTCPKVIIYLTVKAQAFNYISSLLSSFGREHIKETRQLDTELTNLMKQTFSNINLIAERGGIETAKNSMLQLQRKKMLNAERRDLRYTVSDIWYRSMGTIDLLFYHVISAYELYMNHMTSEEIVEFVHRLQYFSYFMSYYGSNAYMVESLKTKWERLNVVQDVLTNPPVDSDQITRNLIPQHRSLDLIDLIIFVQTPEGEKRILLIAPGEARLNYGSIYSLTGPSGRGKSCLVSKIKGVRYNGVGGEGVIQYAENTKIILLSQRDYFPQGTLEEILAYPLKALRDDQKEYALSLCKQLALVGPQYQNLGEKTDWDKASGGEKKRLQLVSALLQKPTILILDEAFDGLDRETLLLVQKLIKQELADGLVIVVDHQAYRDANNFYDAEMHLKCNIEENLPCSLELIPHKKLVAT